MRERESSFVLFPFLRLILKVRWLADLEKDNHVPKECYIKDERGGTIYKDFGWKPIKLNLAPGMVDVKERWTKEVCLESFPLDYSTSLEHILLEQGDKKITSTLKKSKLKGHDLALEMMKTDSEITTAFEGIESVAFGVLGNSEPSEIDEETGDEVWKDVKSLRALLHGATLPKKEGAGVTREAKVIADESFLKARVYYKCYFSNDVATDHELPFDGKPYWKFPMKYLLQYNDMPKQVVVYEDIQLQFFTDIRIAMDNKDWQWVKDENGRWKKQFAAVTTSMSRRKSDGDKTREAAEQAILECSENEEEAEEKSEKETEETQAMSEKEVAEDVEEPAKEEPATEESEDIKEEKENSPAAALEAEPAGNSVSKLEINRPKPDSEAKLQIKSPKPDADGAVLDDSVGRMSIGEVSLEP